MGLYQIFRTSKSKREKPLRDAFFKIDHENCFEYISHSLLKLVQPDDSKQLIGKNIWQEFPTLVHTDFYKNIQSALTRKRIVSFEYYVKSLLTWYRVQIEPTDSGIEVFFNDVTDQVNARKILERGKDRMQTVLQAISQITWTAQPDGKVEYYNQPWEENGSTTMEQPLQHLWATIIHPDDLDKSLDLWYHALKYQENFEIEHRLRRSSKHDFRWHITRATLVKDAAQQITLWVGSSTDIDDQKTAFNKLVQIRKELNDSNNMLKEKNQDLERTNSDLDNFVYAASHDLKAPVSNIEGLTNLLIEGMHQEEIKDRKIYTALSMIDFSIKKFKTTLQDLTDIAKLNRDVYDDISLIDLNDIIEEVTMMIADMIRDANAKINLHIHPHHQVQFSYANLKSLIYNLVSNAVKYKHPDRDAVIDISTNSENGQWILTVTDNGLGIAPQYKDKIFNMFKRLHNHIEGTGMGLFLVKRIVDKAGGSIMLESELEKGSTFKIYLNE